MTIRRNQRSVQWCALIALAASLLFAWSTRAEAAPPTTVAVGDDHLASARDEILGRFYFAGWPASVIVGENGYQFHQLRPYLQFVAGFTPGLKRVYLYAGRYDAYRYSLGKSPFIPDWDINTSLGHLSAAVQDVRSRRPKACIFLTTVFELGPYADPNYYYAANKLNSRMFALQDKYPRVYVIDWNLFQRGTDWLASGGPAHPIAYQLTQSGQNALADFYRFFGALNPNCGQ